MTNCTAQVLIYDILLEKSNSETVPSVEFTDESESEPFLQNQIMSPTDADEKDKSSVIRVVK